MAVDYNRIVIAERQKLTVMDCETGRELGKVDLPPNDKGYGMALTNDTQILVAFENDVGERNCDVFDLVSYW